MNSRNGPNGLQLEARSAETLLSILDNAQLGLWEWNLETDTLEVTPRWASMLGYQLQDLAPINFERFLSLLHKDDKDRVQTHLDELLQRKQSDYQIVFRMRDQSNQWRWIKSHGKVSVWDNDKPLLMAGFHLDVTEEVTRSRLLQKLTDIVPGVIYQFEQCPDGSQRFPYASRKIKDIYGVDAEDVKQDATDVFSRVHPDDLDKVQRSIAESQRQQTPWRCEYRVTPNDEIRWVHGHAIPELTAKGCTLWHGMIMDITRLKEVEEDLRNQSITDSLTHWFNRRHFMQIGSKSVQRAHRQDSRLALIMFDIDHFKQINDKHGHATGDEVLVTVTQQLSNRLRSTDVAARIGGEEFAILLEGASLFDARNIAETLREQVRQNGFSDPNGSAFRITSSFGVSMLNPDDRTIDDLLSRADQALYRAKANGRDRVELA